jgi:protein-tyrosine phosphatase
MIDLHCHILPELDDGSRDTADSLAMARQAAADGIGTVCATPHIRHDHDVHIPEIATRVAGLQRVLDAEGVPVEILAGGELAQTAAEALTLDDLRLVSLGGKGGWVLLEPAPGPIDERLRETVKHLTDRCGARVIVAHPERHAGTDLHQRLRALVDLGCLIQWTAEFVALAQPEDLVLRYAREGLVHLLGSDAHSSLAGRPVSLAAGFTRLREVCPVEWVAWMADQAPRAILAGEPVAIPR